MKPLVRRASALTSSRRVTLDGDALTVRRTRLASCVKAVLKLVFDFFLLVGSKEILQLCLLFTIFIIQNW